MKDHSLEEIRTAAIAVLAKQVTEGNDHGWQYTTFKSAIANHFSTMEQSSTGYNRHSFSYGNEERLSPHDANLFLEVFWGLFQDKIICLGIDDANNQFPWFRVTQWGQQYLLDDNPFRFQDGESYVSLFQSRIPNLDAKTLAYISECAHAYASGCFLAAALTLTFALEHALGLLFDAIKTNPNHVSDFEPVWDGSTLTHQIEIFMRILDKNPSLVTSPAKDDLQTHLATTAAIIRRFREEADSTKKQIVNREDCAHFLQIFLPCCQKIYQLKKFFS